MCCMYAGTAAQDSFFAGCITPGPRQAALGPAASPRPTGQHADLGIGQRVQLVRLQHQALLAFGEGLPDLIGALHARDAERQLQTEEGWREVNCRRFAWPGMTLNWIVT